MTPAVFSGPATCKKCSSCHAGHVRRSERKQHKTRVYVPVVPKTRPQGAPCNPFIKPHLVVLMWVSGVVLLMLEILHDFIYNDVPTTLGSMRCLSSTEWLGVVLGSMNSFHQVDRSSKIPTNVGNLWCELRICTKTALTSGFGIIVLCPADTFEP